MTIFGMPDPTFVVFVGTILAGSIGAIHYVLTYVILGKSIKSVDQGSTPETANPEKERIADGGDE
ncbi:hypothetical protein GCM10008985_30180 [Halococcus dombrowskii]